MAELEKVIKGLECCSKSDNYSRKPCMECPYNHEWRDDQGIVHLCQITQLRKDALFLMKTQEPVKPYMDFDSHDVWRCGNCGATIFHPEHTQADEDERNYNKFCRHCGQAVKWDG